MMHRASGRAAIISQLALLVFACTPMGNSTPAANSTSTGATTLTAEQRASGWRSLFDGTSTAAWRGYKEASLPAGWHIVDGTLTKSGSVGDLLTKDQFGNFELALDWKLGPGGNAGVFYRGTEEYDHIYWSAPEYQLLDDAGHPDGKSRLTSAGADYALYPSPAGVVKPANEWNSSLIVVKGDTVQHWMNGQKLLEYVLGSADWQAKVKASKFVAYPHYGTAPRGYIGIQGDHDGTLSIRNVRIKVLP
jgi:3-keto-disaccharide hydrolase